MRSIIQAAVILLSNVAAFSLLGLVWEVVRGDQYNYNVNSTVLFNYVMSESLRHNIQYALVWDSLKPC